MIHKFLTLGCLITPQECLKSPRMIEAQSRLARMGISVSICRAEVEFIHDLHLDNRSRIRI